MKTRVGVTPTFHMTRRSPVYDSLSEYYAEQDRKNPSQRQKDPIQQEPWVPNSMEALFKGTFTSEHASRKFSRSGCASVAYTPDIAEDERWPNRRFRRPGVALTREELFGTEDAFISYVETKSARKQ